MPRAIGVAMMPKSLHFAHSLWMTAEKNVFGVHRRLWIRSGNIIK